MFEVNNDDAMQALMGLVQQTDAETIKRVQNYADPAERRKAMSGSTEDDSTTVNRTDLKRYLQSDHDFNADRHLSAEEKRRAAATAMNAKGSIGFGGFIPENEFGMQPASYPQQMQPGIPYAPAPFQTPPQPPIVQNLQMPAPATKAIVDALAGIANGLPPALKGLYDKQNELLEEVRRTNTLLIGFLRAYAAANSAQKPKDIPAEDEVGVSMVGEDVPKAVKKEKKDK